MSGSGSLLGYLVGSLLFLAICTAAAAQSVSMRISLDMGYRVVSSQQADGKIILIMQKDKNLAFCSADKSAFLDPYHQTDQEKFSCKFFSTER